MKNTYGREHLVPAADYSTTNSMEIPPTAKQETCGFTLYHVAFQGLKRPNLSEDFLFTYDGKKALQY